MTHFLYPIATIDVVLFTLINKQLHVLLTKRSNPNEPFFGQQAFPGGFVHINENGEEDLSIDDTARRVIQEKTGIKTRLHLEQLKTFSGRNRDPRGWSLSQAYCAIVPQTEISNISANCEWVAAAEIQNIKLAFDHNEIYSYAATRVLNKTNYSLLPAYFLGESFTLTELQKTYEIVLSTTLDKSSFRKKIEGLDAFTLLDDSRGGKQRPAKLYSLKHDTETFFRSNFI